MHNDLEAFLLLFVVRPLIIIIAMGLFVNAVIQTIWG